MDRAGRVVQRRVQARVARRCDGEVEGHGEAERAGRTLQCDGAQVSFTTQEWDLLAVFLSHPNRFMTAREIVRLGWRAGTHEVEQLRTYVRRLRQRLEPLNVPLRLVSHHNRGYCLVVD